MSPSQRLLSHIAATAMILALGATLAAPAADAAAERIRLMTWGGHWLDIFRPIAEKFEKDTGIKVEFVVQAGSSDGMNKLVAQKANPQVDVWTSIESTVNAASAAGLLSKLDAARIPNLKAVPESMRSEYGAAIWLSPRGIFYRKDLVPFKITRWEDLWDPRLKDKLGTSFTLDRGNFLVLAALLNGGSERDIDKGFQKVAALKDNLHAIYKTDPESIKLLETGEIAVAGWGIMPNVYRHLGPDTKYEFVMPAPRFLATIPVSIVGGRGDEQTQAAEKFVELMLAPESQTIMASIAGTIPANPSAAAPEKLKAIIPPLPLTDVYNVDWTLVNAQYSKWEERWMKEVQVRR
ncbi:MAG: extracellular solute-binding protein [Hyphomicrobiaceae bacterium]|nr:extracellular solute-binding protein [Hyphomicrobiaceae bacterium]